MNSTDHIHGRVFSVDQPVQTLHGFGPNEKWKYTDKAGHEHYWKDGYPTLVLKSEHVYCDCCDGYEDDWFECPICGEVIKPTSEPKIYHVAGRISHTIDGMPVTEEEFKKELALAYESLKPKTNGWVFLQFPKGKYFGLVRKDFWEEHQKLDDCCRAQQLEDEGIDLSEFGETMESCFEYVKGYKKTSAKKRYELGLERLRELGFEEVENPFDDDDWDDDDE